MQSFPLLQTADFERSFLDMTKKKLGILPAKTLWVFTFFLFAGLGFVRPVAAQYFAFGKNKVQYKKFEWSYIQSDHFDVYYTDGGEYLAKFTADAAESSYVSLKKDFKYEIGNRISILVFRSHNEFQQNNAIDEYLDEGIGGVTELFKNRVLVPFEGNYKQFRHVIHHELTHAVINDMMYGGTVQSIISNNIRLQLPLWVNEGIAEYCSQRYDTETDMFMRDAVMNNYLPPIQYLNGYFAYRGGQSVFNYIAEKYGKEKIADIFSRIKGTRSTDAGFKAAIGLTPEELSEKWMRDQKIRYWPEIATREDLNIVMKRLTDHKKDGGSYNTNASISPQGDKVAFLSNRDYYFSLYVASTIDPKNIHKLADGQRTANLEELHIITPGGVAWSPNGKKIALATKAGDQDAIIIIDVETEKQEKLTFQLDQIGALAWSPDGSRMAFIGNHEYKSDLYVYEFATQKLTNLTNDVFSDAEPTWSPDSKKLYFSSDRRDNIHITPKTVKPSADGKYEFAEEGSAVFKMRNYDYSQMDLYELDIEKNSLQRLTATNFWDELSPQVSPDGKKLLFISDRNGAYNIYEMTLADSNGTLATPRVRPVTDLLQGVRQISLSADGNKLVCVGLDYAGFDMYMLKMPFEKVIKKDTLDPNIWAKTIAAHQQPPPKDTITMTPLPKKPQRDSVITAPNINIDFHNYVFDQNFEKGVKPEEDEQDKDKFNPKNNLTEDGDYKPKKYKVNFTPDIIYGNASYNALFGAQGNAQFSFSDILGDHQITLFTSLVLDLKNSDYGISYYYLPNRIDYGFNAFHTARLIGLTDTSGNVNYYRYEIYGGGVSASLPLDKFNRIEVGLSVLGLSKVSIDGTGSPDQSTTFLYPSLTFTHDTSLYGFYSPIDGTRYAVSFSGGYGSLIKFGSILADYRTYFRFWKYYSFVTRFSGAYSFGPTPQKFYIGGTENWINRQFQNNTIPITDIQDFIFTTPAVPLRGYNYNVQNGTQFALANFEFRFPFIQYLVAGPIPIPFYNLMGTIFTDLGSAWTDPKTFRGAINDGSGYRLNDLLVGSGFGLRTVLLYFVVRFDVAWSYNFQQSSVPKYYFSLGTDF
jgi:hypothetical protein